MKKATSFFLVFGIIFVPCMAVSAQKPVRSQLDPAARESLRSPGKTRKANDFENVTAFSSGSGVLVKWRMRAETGNIGFYVHRVAGATDSIINDQIIFGSATRTGRYPLYGEEYSLVDIGGDLEAAYYVESLDLDGQRVQSKAVSTRFSSDASTSARVAEAQRVDKQTSRATFESEQLNISKELLAEIRRAEAAPDQAKHAWVISHPGARIDVKKEGIYRVPFTQLTGAGFDTETDQTLWQLYRNGIEQAIRIDTAGSYIEFYGKGIDTPESEVQGYFLINADTAGKRIVNLLERPSTSSITLPSYNQTSNYRERLFYIDTILNGAAENYFGTGIGSGGADILITLSNIDYNSPNATLELKIQGFSAGLHNTQVTLNGHALQPLNGVSQFAFSGTQTIPTSILKDAALGQGANVLNLVSAGPSGDFSLFDTANISFARKHVAIQDTLKAYTARNKKTQIGGFSSPNVRIYDITFENDPRLVTNLTFQDQGGSFGAELSSTRARVFYAAEEGKILSPFAVNKNDGEILSTNSLAADLIVITYKDFRANADAWAEYRQEQGYTVKVVDVEEIFNEFNYGNSSADSIEAFLNYAYNNWTVQPRYVLLIGDATRDPRNYSNVGFFNLVPSRMVTTVFTETGSDDSLTDFNNDGLAEIAIGRIPARQNSAVVNAFQKVKKWEEKLGSDPLARGALFAIDQFDSINNIDFAAISDRIKNELPAAMPKTTVSRAQPNAQVDLLAAFNNVVCDPPGTCESKGKYIVNYTGHGATGTWAGVDFFWLATVSSLTNHDNESIVTMLTCLNGFFLFPNSQGLAETLMSHTNGGAVAAWASTGLTTPDVQEVMARRFYKKVGEGEIQRLGDLIRDAKGVIVGGTDVRQSWALIGDPMLKVR